MYFVAVCVLALTGQPRFCSKTQGGSGRWGGGGGGDGGGGLGGVVAAKVGNNKKIFPIFKFLFTNL